MDYSAEFSEASAVRKQYWEFFAVIVFLILITVKYPLMFATPFPSGMQSVSLTVSSIQQLTALSVFMILLKYRDFVYIFSSYTRLFLISLSVFWVICVLQFTLRGDQSITEFCFNVSWCIIPLSVCLYAQTFKKLLLPYFAFLWFFSMLHTAFWQLPRGIQSVGIAGNRNWHGAFLIATTPFFLYQIFKILKRMGLSAARTTIVMTLPALLALYALFQAESRGANLALIIAVIIFAGLFLNLSPHKNLKRYGKFYLTALAGLILSALIILPLFFGKKLAEINSYDVRIPLWRGAVELFLDNPGLGVGAAGYEGHYSYYIPIEKFLRSHHFANRATHPHNQLLFFAGAYGLPGLLALMFLWGVPLIFFLRNYQNSDVLSKLIFFSLLMLVIHSMFDVVAMRWPTMEMIFLLQGLLWHYTFQRKNILNSIPLPICHANSPEKPVCAPGFIKLTCIITAFLYLVLSTNMLMANIKSSYYSRYAVIAADMLQYPLSIYFTEKAIIAGNDPEDIYHAGMKSLFWLGDYRLAYKFFSRLENHPAKIVVSSNARIAECLIKMNRKREALSYFDKEIRVYPLSSIAVYNKLLLQKDLGDEEAAETTAIQLIQLMHFKGLKLEDMKKIVENPDLDNKFHLIKPD